jgi:hypothetical protein
MTVEACWDSLGGETRRWLLENPGSVVLPRTVVNAIGAASGVRLPVDTHGEYGLSARDQKFIRDRARRAQGKD